MWIAWSAAGLGLLAVLAFVLNGMGAVAQERNGGVGRGFPEWLYSASGYSFYAAMLGLVVLGAVAIFRERRRQQPQRS